MVNMLIRTIELAVVTPFQALAAIGATSPFGPDPCWQHKERGTYLTVGSPIKFSTFTPEIIASPLLGEHTDDVLTELGYDADTIAQLHTDGVV